MRSWWTSRAKQGHNPGALGDSTSSGFGQIDPFDVGLDRRAMAVHMGPKGGGVKEMQADLRFMSKRRRRQRMLPLMCARKHGLPEATI
jgi:hypothetical protein